MTQIAAAILVTLVVVTPWPFGSAHLRTTQGIALVSSLATLMWVAQSHDAGTARLGSRAVGLGLGGLWVLAIAQLTPLPAAIQRVIAPAAAAIWHPVAPIPHLVLGIGARPISLDPAATWRWLGFSSALLGLAIAGSAGLRTRAALLRATTVVVGGALAVAVYGFAARLLFADRLFGVLAVPTIAPFGPFVSKNHFAGYVELAACLAVGLATGLSDEARHGADWLGWLESPRAPWIVTTWGAAAVLVLAVPVSLSRGGTLSLMVGLAAFAVIRLATQTDGRHRARRTLAVGLIALGSLAAIVVVLPETARERIHSLGGIDSAGAYRLQVWRDALRLFAASPFLGTGFGAFADALPAFKTGGGGFRVEHAENDYLELLCEGGAAGFALAGVALAALLAVGWRAARTEPHRLARGLRSGALAGLVALLAHSTVDFNLRIPSNALFAALLVAFLLPEPTRAQGTVGEITRGARGRRLAVVLSALLAAATAVFGPWGARQWDAETLARATDRTALRGAALEGGVTAHLRSRPADAQAWAALAWLRLPTLPGEAEELAAWSQRLDPQHVTLVRASQRVRDAACAALAPGQSQPRSP
jgi:hypothetical protein